MTKIITAALLLALSGATGCIAYAHPPNHHATAYNAQQVQVRAWVWIDGHYTHHGTWTHGHWEVRTIRRGLLSSHPRTHVRWVQGRNRPAQPHRRHRRRR